MTLQNPSGIGLSRSVGKSSFVSTSETMQMEFHGPGQGMPSAWAMAAYNWGRRSRGATVRLGGLGEVGGCC